MVLAPVRNPIDIVPKFETDIDRFLRNHSFQPVKHHALYQSFTTSFTHQPVFDGYASRMKIDDQEIYYGIFDTVAGNNDQFDRLRPLSYPQTSVFVVCFSLVEPISFRNVRDKVRSGHKDTTRSINKLIARSGGQRYATIVQKPRVFLLVPSLIFVKILIPYINSRKGMQAYSLLV
jgi:hypothetical protein